ncbi:MAG: tRNA (adenosine(37)-N6)-dimethylallyltransferase MiaA [Elusimicrobia bacterium]|nr:tRNA (adenosine(37)-N6)-dimethylallyltransferase MiaA [Elusimicrobiota bacterium]
MSPSPEQRKPIVIMGATASGKTDLAVALAKLCGGEIISADSRQVYQELSAGTAKPPGQWRPLPGGEHVYYHRDVPYHYVDFLDPRSSCDAGTFAEQAREIAAQAQGRGNPVIFAGGTGMYIQAYWNGMDSLPKRNPEIRSRLEELFAKNGNEKMHKQLCEVDPAAAEKIPPGNTQRILRALEVHQITGQPLSKLWTGRFHCSLPVQKAVFAVLEWEKPLLRERITLRARAIFDAMREETSRLLDLGYPQDCPALKSIGYPQMIDHLQGKADRTQTLHEIISSTQAYAKRQGTWFRRYKNAVFIRVASPDSWNPEQEAGKLLALASAQLPA